MKVFSIVFGLIASWVSIEYIVGKRTDVVELIAALAFIVILIIMNFHLSRLEISEDQNEMNIIGWFGLRRKVIKLSSVTDIYVERANSIDNHHSIYIKINKRKLPVFEKGGFNKQRIETEITRLYEQLSKLTGIPVRSFYDTTNY